MTSRTSDRTEEFFERLATTPQPMLHDIAATIRIDLDQDGGTRRWLLTVDRGRVTVSHRNARAEVVMGTDRALFEKIVTGEANALTAALRGRIRIEGDARLLVAFSRLMPGPPARTATLPAAGRAAQEAAGTVKAAGTTTRTATVSAAAARATRRDRAR